jgi:outer membrane protein OmpA-like peptidoglycan-associated protein
MKAQTLLIGFLAVGRMAAASPERTDSSIANYVVIGAFAIPENAQKLVKKANPQFPAEYQLNVNRNLYYVYVLKTLDKGQALEQARELREKSPFHDTWVYNGSLDLQSQVVKGTDVHPITEKTIQVTAPDVVPVQAVAALSAVLEPTQAQPATSADSEVSVSTEATNPLAATSIDEDAEGAKTFMFKIYRKSNQKVVEGEVDVIDAEADKRKASYKGNQSVKVRPVNKSGKISMVCEVFGYRKLGHIIDFNQPTATESVTEQNGTVEVPFELVRLKKGDIQVMYQVFFFKDAAIMRPESRYEVNALKEMLQENSNMKIRIHGHTNGNASGKIIQAGGNNFFSLNDSKEGFGSAKKLSEQRAEIIKAYLVSEGVANNRLEVKAWGGKKPIYDKLHSQAQTNVRVEIEVLAD